MLRQCCSLIVIKYVRRKLEVYRLYMLIVLEFLKNDIDSTVGFMKNANIYDQIMPILY